MLMVQSFLCLNLPFDLHSVVKHLNLNVDTVLAFERYRFNNEIKQTRGGDRDNSEMIFLISLQKHVVILH